MMGILSCGDDSALPVTRSAVGAIDSRPVCCELPGAPCAGQDFKGGAKCHQNSSPVMFEVILLALQWSGLQNLRRSTT